MKQDKIRTIYKVLQPAEWNTFQKDRMFYGSELDLQDGFIHCSFESQIERILERFFKEMRPLMVLEIDCEKLIGGSLQIEANKPDGDKYPHLYKPLALEDVTLWKTIE